MNITSYLPDELVRTLDRVAKERQSSPSTVMREALELYLRRMQPSAWPAEVLAWQADRSVPPFESLRGAEQHRVRDPFVPSSAP